MGLVLPQEVEVCVTNSNKAHLVEKNYIIPVQPSIDRNKMVVKRGTKININILDLPKGSHYKVLVECDCCKEKYFIVFKDYNSNLEKSNRTFCNKCAIKDVQCSNKKQYGIYKWHDKKYALAELDKYIEINGTLKGWTVDNAEGNRINTSLKYHGYKIADLCNELGYDYQKLKQEFYPIGYLNKFENIKKEALQFYNSKGFFPTQENFKNDLHIPISILNKFGGLNNIRKIILGDKTNLLEDDSGFNNRSTYEYIVAQFLIHNNIHFSRECHPFPYPHKNFRSDFTLTKANADLVHVEVWGYYQTDDETSRSRQYNLNRKFKESLYIKNNIELVSINPQIFHHPYALIQKELSQVFQPYVQNLLKNIDNNFLVLPNKISNDDLLAQIMKYSDNDKFLPRQDILVQQNPVLLSEMIRRFGGQNAFAKEYSKLTYSKVGLWDKRLIFEIFDSCLINYGYIPTVPELKTKKLSKTDSLLIGLPDGLKRVFGAPTLGYLEYYNTMLINNKEISIHDLQYLQIISKGIGHIKKEWSDAAKEILKHSIQ